jgi:hypothetical protein
MRYLVAAMAEEFALVLFSTEAPFVQAAVAAGVAAVMVDWERRGKSARQAGADTEINDDTPEDLDRVRAATRAHLCCRIESVGSSTRVDVARALAGGADELFVPMVRTPADAEAVIRLANGHCRVSILIETRAALDHLPELAALPLARVYVGLHDLAIERRSRSLFVAAVDGTLEQIRAHFTQPFGFGGLTLPEFGAPIPCRLLIAEMARLDCSFTFLRRSFRRDVRGRSLARELPHLLDAIATAQQRSAPEVARDHQELERRVRTWPGPDLARGGPLAVV